MNKLYILEEDYESFIKSAIHIGSGTEADVYLYKDRIYKIFNTKAHKSRNMHRIRKLYEMTNLDQLLTLPKEELYIDYNFVGYTMENGGITIYDYLKDNDLSNEEKLIILNSIKEVLKELHSNQIIHGDIQSSNILINEDNIKITDINNVIFKNSFTGYLNKLSKKLLPVFGLSKELDIICYNYLAYVIMCMPKYSWTAYLNLAKDAFLNIKNTTSINEVFDDDYLNYQKEIIASPKLKNRKNIDYITNYLK